MAWEVLAVGRSGGRWLVRDGDRAAVADRSEGTFRQIDDPGQALGRGYWDPPDAQAETEFAEALPRLRVIPLQSAGRPLR